MRTPAKILDLKELLYNPAEENVIFDLSNNFGLFEIDQVRVRRINGFIFLLFVLFEKRSFVRIR